MSIVGRPPINPFVFYTGKLAGYSVWCIWVLSVTGVADFSRWAVPALQDLSVIIFGTGLIVVLVSLVNLGQSTRLGLPDEETELETHGLYRFSRNPMYVGFHLFTLASVIYTFNPYVIVAGTYSLVVYHCIIKAEERFLEERFGRLYISYKQKVRRYL